MTTTTIPAHLVPRLIDLDKTLTLGAVLDALSDLVTDLEAPSILEGQYWDANTRTYEVATPEQVRENVRDLVEGFQARLVSEVAL